MFFRPDDKVQSKVKVFSRFGRRLNLKTLLWKVRLAMCRDANIFGVA